MDSVKWPSSVGRVPKNLSSSGSSKKADEWRRLVTILPVVLWFVWRDHLDNIPSGAPRVPRDAKKPPKFQRCRQRIYDLVLYLCVAVSLLGTAVVTLEGVARGQTFLRLFCEGLIGMKVHLKPNHHWAMHYEPIFRRFGPAYAWWVYAYERFNGLLQSVNLNFHPGQMETTLMRFWVRMHRLYELALFLPEDASPAERELMDSVCKEFGKRSATTVSGPSISSASLVAPSTDRQTPTNLRRLEHRQVYELLLAYAQARWPDMDLRHNLDLQPGGTLFMCDQVAYMLSYVTKSGVRFGSASAQRTRRDQYAFVRLDGQSVPCQMLYHFKIQVLGQQPVICSLIKRFVRDDNLPRFPWDIRAVELGIYTAYADQLGALEVVDSEKIQAPLALCIVRTKRHRTKVWIAVMYEKGGMEDDDEGVAEEEDGPHDE
ncbi:hypothetical protein FRC07_006898 [Ceratobasidium sp. 392]|nr:hypothetical protein FRC07_006898 [Ceratobasidium sp. 392]